MCLTITIEIAGFDSLQLRRLAQALPRDEVDLVAQGPGLLRRHAPRLALHGCHLLADEANWNASTWAMTDEGESTLNGFFETLFRLVPGEMSVSASWEGDQPDREDSISRAELLNLIATSGLGTRTRYVVTR